MIVEKAILAVITTNKQKSAAGLRFFCAMTKRKCKW
ncbi:hypothetical protein JNUCC1_03651 [Lentibacillus sp. JNUCC-1]|nr:hypothetical protein [Lentibacillus sp. JNUCC-1]